MTEQDTPNIDAARTELARVLQTRAQRARTAIVAGGLLAGIPFLAWPLILPSGDAATVIGLVGGLGFLLSALVVGLGIVRVTGHNTRYQHDRITYLQAYVAAHDAAAAMVPRTRGSRPKPRPALPPTAETLPPTIQTLERF